MSRSSIACAVIVSLFLHLTLHVMGQAQVPDQLAPVARLAGGRWMGEGKWPDGTALRVEQRYFWGPTRRVLHFETYDVSGNGRTLLYEGLLYFDPKRNRVIQQNFKQTGAIDVIEMTRFDGSGFEVKGEKTWSLIQYTGQDQFSWELRIPQNGDWKSILNATYLREQ